MTNTIGKRIKHFREIQGYSQKEFAIKLGMAPAMLSQYENGKRRVNDDTKEKIANALDISISQLFGETKSDSHFVTLPIVGEIRAGFPTLVQENIIGYEAIPIEWLHGGEYFILRVSGDSMIDARIKEGDKVLVRVQSTCENGQIAVVTIADVEPTATLKRVFVHADAIELVPENRKYPRMLFKPEQVQIRGIVKKVFFDI